jgi:hypothetical protein
MPSVTIAEQEYAHFRARFGDHLLGVIEIGSFARAEALPFSDHDLRLIIHSDKPLLLFNEHVWTESTAEVTTPIEWHELNHCSDLSFGLSNLAYIERLLQTNRFPLLDHTCLYQGRILIDDSGAVAAFQQQYAGRRFDNIVHDYLRQTTWRVTSRLARERSNLSAGLEHQKYAVPALHTCYRIVRDLANIARYQAQGGYITDPQHLVGYYQESWPWFTEILQALRAYKTNEEQRRIIFTEVSAQVPERLAQLQEQIAATVRLWEQFSKQYAE